MRERIIAAIVAILITAAFIIAGSFLPSGELPRRIVMSAASLPGTAAFILSFLALADIGSHLLSGPRGTSTADRR